MTKWMSTVSLLKARNRFVFFVNVYINEVTVGLGGTV